MSVLLCLSSLLTSPKKIIVKDACICLSKTLEGKKENLQFVIEADIIPLLISLMKSGTFDVKLEVALVLKHATSGSPAQVSYIVDKVGTSI